LQADSDSSHAVSPNLAIFPVDKITHFVIYSQGYGPFQEFVDEIGVAEDIFNNHGRQTEVLPVGVGFLVWKLNESTDSATYKALAYVLERKVKAIWLSFGDKIETWIKYIREHPSPHKPLVVVLVNTVEAATLAVEEWEADIIVAQGTGER
jgi:NAD(P)H-dependent flavin oxidoreductase YrpB (nitropropane dioxygenase family)